MSSQQNQPQKISLAFNCQFCGRALKNDKSKAKGYGVCCGKRNNLIEEKKKKIIVTQKSHNLFEY